AAAIPEYMKVLELDPKNAPAHDALGNIYFDQAQYPMAEEQFRAAIAVDSSRANYHVSLAAALAKEGKKAEAETEYRTAIGFDPRNVQAHMQLAELLGSMPGRVPDSMAEYAWAKTLDPALVVPTPAETPVPSVAMTPNVKPLKPPRVFLLTHDSPVYTSAD